MDKDGENSVCNTNDIHWNSCQITADILLLILLLFVKGKCDLLGVRQES